MTKLDYYNDNEHVLRAEANGSNLINYCLIVIVIVGGTLSLIRGTFASVYWAWCAGGHEKC